jgi:hypothetical protein
MVRLVKVLARHQQHARGCRFEKEVSQTMIGHFKKAFTTNLISELALPRSADSINSHSGDAV